MESVKLSYEFGKAKIKQNLKDEAEMLASKINGKIIKKEEKGVTIIPWKIDIFLLIIL